MKTKDWLMLLINIPLGLATILSVNYTTVGENAADAVNFFSTKSIVVGLGSMILFTFSFFIIRYWCRHYTAEKFNEEYDSKIKSIIGEYNTKLQTQITESERKMSEQIEKNNNQNGQYNKIQADWDETRRIFIAMHIVSNAVCKEILVEALKSAAYKNNMAKTIFPFIVKYNISDENLRFCGVPEELIDEIKLVHNKIEIEKIENKRKLKSKP